MWPLVSHSIVSPTFKLPTLQLVGSQHLFCNNLHSCCSFQGFRLHTQSQDEHLWFVLRSRSIFHFRLQQFLHTNYWWNCHPIFALVCSQEFHPLRPQPEFEWGEVYCRDLRLHRRFSILSRDDFVKRPQMVYRIAQLAICKRALVRSDQIWSKLLILHQIHSLRTFCCQKLYRPRRQLYRKLCILKV